ncbi:MEF2-activating motif and SAP domain-containing transcriptional regulator [Crotalus adamanteus]|uniref:Phosphatase and actin regulator n=1 Tax=Crotalus adamanteus TaxID=8729 RepID=A0AAW1B164_CROAD
MYPSADATHHSCDAFLVASAVLQMRMQHRRSQEQLSELHLIPGLSKSLPTFSQPSGTQGQTRANETAKLKVSPQPHKTNSAKGQLAEVSRGDRYELQEKKARLAEDLSEKILHRPGPLELVKKNILPLDPGIKDVVADAAHCGAPDSFNVEEDLSSSSSSSSPCFTLSPASGQGNPSTSEAVFQRLCLTPTTEPTHLLKLTVVNTTSSGLWAFRGSSLPAPGFGGRVCGERKAQCRPAPPLSSGRGPLEQRAVASLRVSAEHGPFSPDSPCGAPSPV